MLKLMAESPLASDAGGVGNGAGYETEPLVEAVKEKRRAVGGIGNEITYGMINAVVRRRQSAKSGGS